MQRALLRHWRAAAGYRRGVARSGAALRERARRTALRCVVAAWAIFAAQKRHQRAAVTTAARLLAVGSLARAFCAWRALAQVCTCCADGLCSQWHR